MTADTSPKSRAPQAQPQSTAPPPMFDMIELFFFAYRDFVSDADRLLATLDFGRAHHRVIHFVSRQPGLTVAELLDILKITKQSLNRVMKELIDAAYVEVRAGVIDRRQRLLYPTGKGKKLAMDLALMQSQRFTRALSHLETDAHIYAIKFLTAMIDSDERSKVERLIWHDEKSKTP